MISSSQDAAALHEQLDTLRQRVAVLEQQLADQQGKYALLSSLLHQLPDGIGIVCQDGNLLYANQSLQQKLSTGLETDSTHIQELNDPLLTSVADLMQQITEQGGWSDILKHIHSDRGSFDEHVSAVTLADEQGDIRAVGVIVRDVSESLHIINELRKFQQAVEQSSSSIIISDVNGKIEYINPGFTRLTGYTLEEVRGKNPRVLQSGTTPSEMYDSLWQTILAGQEWRGEFRNRRKNGELFWELASVAPIFDATGTITHFVAVKEDITRRKQMEETLRQSQAELERRVQERTAALLASNRALQAEIQERSQAEAALRRSEAQFRAFFEHAPLAIGVSRDGIALAVNPAYLRLFGWDHADQVIGQPISVNIVPDERQATIERARRRRRGEAVETRFSLTGLRRDGAVVPTICEVAQMILSDGQIASVAFFTDISEQKQAEEAVRQSAARSEALVRIAERLNAQLDLDAVLGTVCEEASSVLAIPGAAVGLYDSQQDAIIYQVVKGVAADLLAWGRPLPRALVDELTRILGPVRVIPDVQAISPPPPNAEFFRRADVRTMVQANIVRDDELVGVLNVFTLGEERSFSSSELQLLQGIASQAAQAITNARLFDAIQEERALLEQRVAERTTELQKSQLLLQQMVEHSPAAIFLKDMQRRYLLINRLFALTMGYEPQQMIGRTEEDLFTPEQVAAWQEIDQRIIATGKPCELEAFAHYDDGQHIFLLNKFPLYDMQGAVYAIGGVATDITSLKRIETALRERTAELSSSNAELTLALRSRDEFLANMSHELRTPLHAILGLSEALQEDVYGMLNPRQQDALQTIEGSGRHLLTLINDILDLARMEEGKVNLNLDTASVRSVCASSLHMIKQTAYKKGLTVAERLDERVTLMYADERRLKQVLVNLLNNAVKFTPEGGQIGLEVAGDSEHGVVQFTIWDTGIGIAPEQMERLFKPFVQIDSGLNRQHEGTGLGLVLVARLTKLHGGSVTVESEPQQGSRFTVRLPWLVAATDSMQPKGRTAGPARPDLSAGAVDDSLPPILLADDGEISRAMLTEHFSVWGYRLELASSSEEMLHAVRDERPVLLLLDIQLPGFYGQETIHRIRAEAGRPDLPIVALTSLRLPGDRERWLAAGATEYLSKPVSGKQLQQIVEQCLKD